MICRRWSCAAAAFILVACSSSHGDDGNEGQTHWLERCDSDADCGSLSCICDVCIVACDDAQTCSVEGRATECQSSDAAAARALCGGAAPMPICLEPCASGCDSGQRCVGDACVTAEPDGAGGAGADGGDPAGAGGASGAGPASGSGGAAGTMDFDAGADAVDCAQSPPVFPSFDRSCDDALDCGATSRQVDCCGSRIVTGMRSSELERYGAAASECASQFPECDCAAGPPRADDGTTGQVDMVMNVDCIENVCTTTFATPVVPCGPDGLMCTVPGTICVQNMGWTSEFTCQPVPSACQDDRTCGCLAEPLCAPGFACTTVTDEQVSCVCLGC